MPAADNAMAGTGGFMSRATIVRLWDRREPHLRYLSFWFLAFILSLSTPAHADKVFPDGSSWGLAPPSGFEQSQAFSGFVKPSTGSAIVFVDIPAPHDQIAPIVEQMAEQFEMEGLEITDRDSFENAALKGRWIKGIRRDGGRTWHFAVLLVAGPNSLGQVIAMVPQAESSQEEFERVLDALSTLTAREARSIEEQVAALPFAFTELGEMRVTLTVLGTSVGLTVGPDDTSDPELQPQLVISHGPLSAPVAQADYLAVSRATFDERYAGAQIESEETIMMAGLPAIRIVAAVTAPDAKPFIAAQWTIFDGGKVFLAIGSTVASRRADDIRLFETVLDGLRAK